MIGAFKSTVSGSIRLSYEAVKLREPRA